MKYFFLYLIIISIFIYTNFPYQYFISEDFFYLKYFQPFDIYVYLDLFDRTFFSGFILIFIVLFKLILFYDLIIILFSEAEFDYKILVTSIYSILFIAILIFNFIFQIPKVDYQFFLEEINKSEKSLKYFRKLKDFENIKYMDYNIIYHINENKIKEKENIIKRKETEELSKSYLETLDKLKLIYKK